MYDLYNLPSRASEDGPDVSERTVFVTTCKACGWEDETAHDDQADCVREKCPDCASEYLVDMEMLQEFYK